MWIYFSNRRALSSLETPLQTQTMKTKHLECWRVKVISQLQLSPPSFKLESPHPHHQLSPQDLLVGSLHSHDELNTLPCLMIVFAVGPGFRFLLTLRPQIANMLKTSCVSITPALTYVNGHPPAALFTVDDVDYTHSPAVSTISTLTLETLIDLISH